VAPKLQTKVAVLGLGYICLPTAAVVARSGATVLGVDVHQHVVDTVNSGGVHIEEVDLDALVRGVVQRGLMRASTQLEPSDVSRSRSPRRSTMIAVPTPFDDDRAPDLRHVLTAARSIAPVLKTGDTVILESTSPVGTTEQVRDAFEALRPDLKFPHAGNGAAEVACH
jgi:UDP-N-acetyl-D-mannosaminuronic acid dehydrogenase